LVRTFTTLGEVRGFIVYPCSRAKIPDIDARIKLPDGVSKAPIAA